MKSPHIDQLEQQSELTRRRLERTLDDLRLHLSARYQLQRVWNATKHASTRTLRRSGRWAGAHPVTLVTLGVTLLAALYLSARRRGSVQH